MIGSDQSSIFHEFIRSRRSVRRFLPRQVERTLVERILETATWSPSAHNRQPWRFVVLTKAETKRNLSAAMAADFRRDLLADGLDLKEVDKQVNRSQDRINAAPVVILLCLDRSVLDQYPDETRAAAEVHMGMQSVALAGGTILLAAHVEGIGGVWMCAPLFTPAAIKRVLELPDTWDPQGLILLGYPAKIPDPRERRPVTKVAWFDEDERD